MVEKASGGSVDEASALALIEQVYGQDPPAEGSNLPIYRRLSATIQDLILSGSLLNQSKLPTLQDLADRLGLSRGTVAHAYRLLDTQGLVKLTQGRGSFVCCSLAEPVQAPSRKEKAEAAIEDLLSFLRQLDFSRQEIGILLDLKMREFYEEKGAFRVAIFADSLEDRHILWREFSSSLEAEFAVYSLDDFLCDKVDLSLFDCLICSEEVYFNIKMRLKPEQARKLLLACMGLDPHTILSLANLKREDKLGLVCFSPIFAHRMQMACEEYTTLKSSPQAYLLSQDDPGDLTLFLKGNTTILFPFACFSSLNHGQREQLAAFVQKGGSLLDYALRPEKSSLLALSLRLEEMTDRRKD